MWCWMHSACRQTIVKRAVYVILLSRYIYSNCIWCFCLFIRVITLWFIPCTIWSLMNSWSSSFDSKLSVKGNLLELGQTIVLVYKHKKLIKLRTVTIQVIPKSESLKHLFQLTNKPCRWFCRWRLTPYTFIYQLWNGNFFLLFFHSKLLLKTKWINIWIHMCFSWKYKVKMNSYRVNPV